MPRCKSCDAEILWVETTKGGKMPVDAGPRKMVILVRGDHGHRVDKRVGQDEVDELKGEVVTAYTAHFATCPDADKHRK